MISRESMLDEFDSHDGSVQKLTVKYVDIQKQLTLKKSSKYAKAEGEPADLELAQKQIELDIVHMIVGYNKMIFEKMAMKDSKDFKLSQTCLNDFITWTSYAMNLIASMPMPSSVIILI